MYKHLFFILLGLVSFSNLFCQLDTINNYKSGKLGVGAELGPSSGAYFLTGSSKNKINNGSFSNVAFIFSYNKLHFTGRLGGISGSIKETILGNPNWNKGSSLWTSHIELAVGYQLLNTKRFNIIPYIGGGLQGFNIKNR